MIAAITSIPGWHLYILYVFIGLFAGVHIARDADRQPAHKAEIVLLYMIGFNGISGFIGHTVFADQLAESIGMLSMNFIVPLVMIALYVYIQRGSPQREKLDYRPLQA